MGEPKTTLLSARAISSNVLQVDFLTFFASPMQNYRNRAALFTSFCKEKFELLTILSKNLTFLIQVVISGKSRQYLFRFSRVASSEVTAQQL